MVVIVVFMALAGFALEASGMRHHFSLRALHDHFEAHLLQGILIFIVLFAVGNLAHFPGLLFLSSAVLTLGVTGGVLLTYTAAVVSCAVTFFVIRLVGSDALRRIDNRYAVMLFRQLDARPIRSVALLRVLMQTLPTLNCALALSGLRFRDYMLGTIIGLPLPTILYAVFLDAAASVLKLPHY
ncbi:MAG: TVP38/TMEM64 family protein [Comamonadaceae bacterium]|nr:MAG: TVP38/TMEM64 family protein [Comamonadaceae bacterium]